MKKDHSTLSNAKEKPLESNDSLFEHLMALENNSFPKKCPTCGAVYQNIEDFTRKTQHISGKSGFKSAEGDEGETILELFRNCICGSTLLDFFSDRRDTSNNGEKRRLSFNKVLEHLVKNGVEIDKARSELKYYIKHKESEFFERLGIFKIRANSNTKT